MKQSKQGYHDRVARGLGNSAGDTRPTKPLAGETMHHVVHLPPRTGPAKETHRPDTGRDTRRAKPAFEGADGPPERFTLPDQEPLGHVDGQGAGAPGEQYVRLRIRVRDGQLRVIDSHLVDGPLNQSATFHGASAYDVTYQDRLLHAGTIPDVGMQRSFPNPDGPAAQRAHHLTPREITEFSARVPAREVTPETIAGIRVRLHRVEEASAATRLTAAPLAVQFAGRITPTAELVGLPESTLPEAIEIRGGRTARGEG